MKLRSFRLARYGPVSDVEISGLASFNLFHGPNEEGKTLMIEALVRLLAGKTPRGFSGFERVEEAPSGFVVVDDGGRHIECPRDGKIPGLLGISGEEFRNIFVIRNSDLSLEGEKNFYTGIGDRLTGLKTERLAGVKKRLLELGKLTPGSGNFRDVKEEKLLSRLRSAEELSASAGKLMEELAEKDYDGLSEKKFRAVEELAEAEREIEILRKARERDRYLRCRRALEEAREALDKLSEYEHLSREDMRLWSERLRDEERLKAEKARCEERLAGLLGELERLEPELLAAESERAGMERKKSRVDQEIRPLLKEHSEISERVNGMRSTGRFAGRMFLLSSALLLISVSGLALSPGLMIGVFSGVFFISSAFFSAVKLRLHAEQGRLSAVSGRLSNLLAEAGFRNASPAEAGTELANLSVEYERASAEESRLREECAAVRREAENLRDDSLPRITRELSGARAEILVVSGKSGSESLAGYGRKLAEKEKLERALEQNSSVLENELGGREGPLTAKLEGWEKDAASYSEYAGASPGAEFEPGRFERLYGDRERFKAALEETSSELGRLEASMRELWRRTSEVLAGEGEPMTGSVPCTSSGDVAEIKRRLDAFSEKYHTLRKDALDAIALFDEIEEEEKSKISGLFGGANSASVFFRDVTGGKYAGVLFDGETGGLSVRTPGGEVLAPEKLSGGAFDQLYFSVRLALGRKLLEGGAGFFMFDDPFIKADSERLVALMKMLRDAVSNGWQVLYFTAKDEVRDILSEAVGEGDVKYFEAAGYIEK